jgi:hypothetical protein
VTAGRLLGLAGLVAITATAPRPVAAREVELWLPEGSPQLRGVLAFTSVGIAPAWGRSPDFLDLARRLQSAIVEITDEDAIGAYL